MTGTALTSEQPDVALEALHVCVRIGGRVLVDDVTVRFARGQTHAIVGRSGAGKSVLMKAVVGLLPMERGQVRLHARSMAFVHQEPALLDDLTVFENVAFAVTRRDDVTPLEARTRVVAALRALALISVAHRLPAALPPGTVRRVSIARALALQPEVLILDEPTTALDPDAAHDVDEALAALAPSGATLIVITHSRRTLERLQPRILRIDRGRLA